MCIRDRDSKVAGYAHDQGKACIIVVNKWDAVDGKETTTMELQRRDYAECFSFMGYAPIIFISAQTGYNVNKMCIRDRIRTANGFTAKASSLPSTPTMKWATEPDFGGTPYEKC